MPQDRPTSKQRLKTIDVGNFYRYEIYEICAGNETYLEAVPLTPHCVTRIAGNEQDLLKILERDVSNVNKFVGKIK